MEAHICMECSSVIRGRTDKKFCNDFCRNSYHNRMKKKIGVSVKKINKILRNNYLILKEKIPEETGKRTITRDELLTSGFSFKYHTSIYTTKKGNTYFFCYEFGYMELDENKLILVKRANPD